MGYMNLFSFTVHLNYIKAINYSNYYLNPISRKKQNIEPRYPVLTFYIEIVKTNWKGQHELIDV